MPNSKWTVIKKKINHSSLLRIFKADWIAGQMVAPAFLTTKPHRKIAVCFFLSFSAIIYDATHFCHIYVIANDKPVRVGYVFFPFATLILGEYQFDSFNHVYTFWLIYDRHQHFPTMDFSSPVILTASCRSNSLPSARLLREVQLLLNIYERISIDVPMSMPSLCS